jgi:anti-sigma regulatory factor (Ser/Thr protein kinase)
MTVPAGFRHEAFPYAGEDDFVRMAAEFLGTGVAGGEPGVLVTAGERFAGVRAALGAAAERVRFVDLDVAGHNPALILSVLDDFVGTGGGARVRGLSGPVYQGRSPAAQAEAELHELMLNTPVCHDWNMWLGCPYDTTRLDEATLRAIRACHPAGGADLTNVVAEKFAAALPPRPADADTFAVDSRDLSAVRTVVRTAATMAGLAEERAEGFVYAVNEVVTNSIRHGAGPAELALWSADGSLVCEVHDGGRIEDVLAGRLAPPVGRIDGRGLWLVNHLCDLVQVRSLRSGTFVRMHIGP